MVPPNGSEPHDQVDRGDELEPAGLIVVRPRVRRPVNPQLGPDADIAIGLVSHARRHVYEAGRKPRAAELGRPGTLLIAEPLGPRADPKLRIDVVEEIDRGAVPLRVLLAARLPIHGRIRL